LSRFAWPSRLLADIEIAPEKNVQIARPEITNSA
jgi:hypothetical protein